MSARTTYNSSLTAALKQNATINSLMHNYEGSRPFTERKISFERPPKTLSLAAALHNVGLRLDEGVTLPPSKTWCLCDASLDDAKNAMEEDLTRCSNREVSNAFPERSQSDHKTVRM